MAGLGQELQSDWRSMWSTRENAFLAYPSLAHIDHNDKVSREAIYDLHAWSDPVWARNEKIPCTKFEGNLTSIVSQWNQGSNYYHWFMDGLTRLIHLDSFPSDCRIIIPRGSAKFALRSLEILGLSDRIVYATDSDLEVEHYWFGSPTMLSGCPDPMGVKWLRNKFLNHLEPDRHRKIYIERSAPTRRLTNSTEVRKLFIEKGWEIIDPGTLSLDQQIATFSEALAIAGVHGAAMTNLLWSCPGTRVLEFMPSRRRNGCYAGISIIVGLDHEVLVSPSDRKGNISVSAYEVSDWIDRQSR